MKIVKKNGSLENFNPQKIVGAIRKSAERSMIKLSEEQEMQVVSKVQNLCDEYSGQYKSNVPVKEVHKMVEVSLMEVQPSVGEAYRNYRNYKKEFVGMLDQVYRKAQSVLYVGDKENSNADSSLVSTKRSLIAGELSKELYQHFFLTPEEKQACQDGFIYVHDMRDRMYTMNCCLADVSTIMKGGFEMGNIWYNEPKTLDVACDVLGDIIMSMAGQQYGGFTVAEVDTVLVPYCEKSYQKYRTEYLDILSDNCIDDINEEAIHNYAKRKVYRELEQGIQGLEIKLNSVGSARGDYPFTTFSFGLDKSEFGQMVSEVILKVRKEGQGKEGFKKTMLFPKLVFIYSDEVHGKGKEMEHLFDKAIACSSKSMYPDYLSVDNGYTGDMYKKYGKVVSPMGCRAYLSPWYEKGGMYPIDEQDAPIFISRANIGAITLHLCLIYQEAKTTGQDFYKLLDYYLEMIRSIHKRTYDYLGKMKASTNPLGYTQGGFLGGTLDFNDEIAPVLKSFTASFGFTALNELCQLHYGKSIVEDNTFANEVIDYILAKIEEYKKEDGWLYALYATPAESLVGLQVQQFRKRFGIIEKVSDKEYMSNGFHCHVSENITPYEKQDAEYELFHKANGGHITYTRYNIDYNLDAIKTTVRRGMAKGFYQGVNLALSTCDDCGHKELDMDSCPKCGSYNLTKVDRMNGYLSYSRVKGDSRLNEAKMAELKERISM